jgi:hypothetical protein
VKLEYIRDINTIEDKITALENAISNLSWKEKSNGRIYE